MSLMQIAEPGESVAKAACKGRVIGIDLGTTNSLVAYVADGAPRVIAGSDGRALLPSVVHYGGDGQVIVGAGAEALAAVRPSDTIASVKRFVGRGPEDAAATAKLSSYVLDDASDGGAQIVRFRVAGDRRVTPVEVSAEILRALVRRAQDHFSGADEGADGAGESDPANAIDGAVITVPAYFDDAQRQATRDAGRLAGLEVMRLLAEPTAAALAYGLDRGQTGVYAVYDLGGGTFDISILRLVEGVFEVKATGGDSALGGDDFDRLVAAEMLAEAGFPLGEAAQPDARTDARTDTDADVDVTRRQLVRRAVAEARAAKERLTDADETDYTLALPDGRAFTRTLTRQRFAALIEPLLTRTARACRRALADAEVTAAALDGVILVGGSTRSPVVQQFVASVFGRAPLSDLDPEQVVALGAAAQAEILAGGGADVLLLDVIPLSLGIETMGGVVEKIIHRNATIPTGARQEFTTYADNQTGFDIHVVQGERETVDANRSLARFQLKGIPPMVAGMARVEITFVVDADGILMVSAREKLTGLEAAIEVKPSYGLTDEEVERMLMDSFEHAEDDLVRRNLQVERVEAERILAATEAALAADRDLLEDDVEAATRQAMARLRELAAGDDHLAIRAAIEALDLASKPFAQRRMDRAVSQAIRGRAVAEVADEMASDADTPSPP